MDTTASAHTINGVCDPRFASVREQFERNFTERDELGAAVCVYVDGESVVDLWGGVADEATGAPWQRDTMNVIMSCTKGLTAMCGHILVDRGDLDLDAPIARYWPEFAQKGKADIPVRMVFSHQSGVAHVRDKIPRGGCNDWDLMIGLIERTKPFWEPGTKAGYHGVTFGFIIGELVHRITGMSLGTFFRQEIAEPLKLDAWIGLPLEHEHRVAASLPVKVDLPEPPAWLPRSVTDPTSLVFRAMANGIMRTPPVRRAVTRRMISWFTELGLSEDTAADAARLDSLTFQMFGNLGDWLPDLCDTRETHAAELPAAGGIATARALAGAYRPLSLGGAVDGFRLVSQETVDRMRLIQSMQAADAVLNVRTAYTLGFSKSWWNPHRSKGSSVILGEDAFGTPGMGGQIGFADPSHRLAFAYTMTRHGAGTGLNDRGQSLVDATYEALGSQRCEQGAWLRRS